MTTCLGFNDFYRKANQDLKNYGVKIVKYPGKGLGIRSQKVIGEGEIVFCVNSEDIILSSDFFEYSDVIVAFPEYLKLVVRLLYEKFVSKTNNLFKKFADSLPALPHSTLMWQDSHKNYFEKVNILPYDFADYDPSEGYDMIKFAFKNLFEIPHELLEFSSYKWAYSHTISRMFEYDEEIVALIPILDLVNHWPNPSLSRSSPFLYSNLTHNCLITARNVSVGEEFFIDYGKHDSLTYFFNYQIVIENHSYDFLYFEYFLEKSGSVYFYLYGDIINPDLLETLIYEEGICMSFNKRFKGFFVDVHEYSEEKIIIKALKRYRYEFIKYFATVPIGIRELRNESHTDECMENIRKFAIQSRKTYYNHLSIVDHAVAFGLLSLIFNN